MMDLSSLKAVAAAPKPDKPFRFYVTAGSRSLYLQAEGEEQFAGWLAAFRALLPGALGQPAAGPPSGGNP
jgi:hypothetical protein